MAIRITRNEEGNCITFVGSSNPAYWNACLSAQLNEDDPTRVDIINDIRTANEDTVQYEFYAVEHTDFADRDNNVFTSAQDMVDYVNDNANVIGLSPTGKDLTGIDMNFRLDDTHTSIIMDNGFAFGVNTIKAVADKDGTIHIKAIGTGTPANGTSGDKEHFTHIEHTRVAINNAAVSGGINDVVNTLNELFTVGAFEAVVIADPYSTMVADVAGEDAGYTLVGSTAVDPTGADIFTNSGSGNYAGLLSTATIDQAGEYYTFDIRGEGQIGFGLVHTQASYDAGHHSGSATYANPATFATSNSAHYGYQFSHWFHPTPNGSWTNYGANTSYVMGPAWYSANTQFEGRDEWLAGTPIKMRVGINENGFIHIDSLKDDGVTWVTHARTGYPVAQGSEFRLGIKAANAAPRVATAPKVHLLEEEAPTMNFRYVESPDGVFQYPLFATQEEAEYYDKVTQGTETGAATATVFSDEPTFTTWYRPDHNYTSDGTAAPVAQSFNGQQVNYTEITTLTNAALVPSSYTDQTIQVNELSSVNIATQPEDTGYTTAVSGLPAGLSALPDGSIHGTAPEVTGDYDGNPSDDYTITVTRTNSYGSSTGTLTLRVINLTAPATAISGFNHDNTSPNLVDSNTLDSGSAVHLNTTLTDGERFVIEKSYVETNVLPALNGPGDRYYMGLAASGHSFATLENADWDAAIVWEYETATSHTFKFLNKGSVNNNIVVSSMTNAFYDFAVEINGTSAWLIACNVNSISNEPSPADGGQFSNTLEVTSLSTSAPHTVHIAATMQADFSSTGIYDITTPAAPVTNLTSWSRALDFSASNEYAVQVNNSMYSQALQMNGLANTVDLGTRSQGETSDASSSRPWATCVVFKSDGYSGNQMIWNQGEGSASGNDNIFLNVTAAGNVNFGWGREGVGYNQCRVASNISPDTWYGVYVAHSGVRLSGNNATAANLADCFDIRIMSSADSFASLSTNLSSVFNWTVTGYRMDRTVAGDFTIGGRGTGYGFRGKVASMIVTTLIGQGTFTPEQQPGGLMYNEAQIEKMITDPVYWVNEYKVRHGLYNTSAPFRGPASAQTVMPFLIGSQTSAYQATQMWLMGDGASDSYANGIRNYINTADQNYSKLQLNNMVSNDIENVTIPGLS